MMAHVIHILILGEHGVICSPRITACGSEGISLSIVPSKVVIDRATLQAICDGDEDAFAILVARYSHPMTLAAIRVLGTYEMAEDVVHDVFLWLWRHRADIDIDGSLQNYLASAVRHRALNVIRRFAREKALAKTGTELGEALGVGEPVPSPDMEFDERQLAYEIDLALAALPPRMQEVARLRWCQWRSRVEIASALGISISTVSNTLVAASHKLRDTLSDHRVQDCPTLPSHSEDAVYCSETRNTTI